MDTDPESRQEYLMRIYLVRASIAIALAGIVTLGGITEVAAEPPEPSEPGLVEPTFADCLIRTVAGGDDPISCVTNPPPLCDLTSWGTYASATTTNAFSDGQSACSEALQQIGEVEITADRPIVGEAAGAGACPLKCTSLAVRTGIVSAPIGSPVCYTAAVTIGWFGGVGPDGSPQDTGLSGQCV